MSLRAVCRRCGHVWQYSGRAKYATCPYCMGKTPVRFDSLREWHDANRPAIVMRGGYTYVVVPRDDDLGGFLPGRTEAMHHRGVAADRRKGLAADPHIRL